MTPQEALAQLGGNPQKAEEMARYHKVDRPYLGVANPDIDAATKAWRKEFSLEDRLKLSSGLWDSNVHEGRVAAAKLLTQARIRPDDQGAWELVASWVPSFDAWAVADHACIAGQKRVGWNPDKLNEVETLTTAEHMLTRPAALVITLPWTKQNHPKPAELAARERILGWAAGYVEDHDWFIQKSIAWWLRELSKHDADRVKTFLSTYGEAMKPFARKEAVRKLA